MPRVAKAHAVFDRFCGSKVVSVRSADADIAFISGTEANDMLAPAQAGLARFCGSNVEIMLMDCAAIASNRGQ